MKKNVLELGIPLSREEAGKIVGGSGGQMCVTHADCPMGSSCDNGICAEGDIACPPEAANCIEGKKCSSTLANGIQRHGVCGIENLVLPGTNIPHPFCTCLLSPL